MNLENYFDRIVVINLDRRPERMARLEKCLQNNWPFQYPERFAGIDGHAIPTPQKWKLPAGAWGCMLSHRAVLKSAIEAGAKSILIMEDDAQPVSDFCDRVKTFLENVPADWECLMLGGQHLLPPTDVSPGIVQCTSANRCHAYALRGPFMEMLLKLWHIIDNHCDVTLASTMVRRKAYAPKPFLIGQAAGASDISMIEEPERFWSGKAAVEAEAMLLHLVELLAKAPKPIAA